MLKRPMLQRINELREKINELFEFFENVGNEISAYERSIYTALDQIEDLVKLKGATAEAADYMDQAEKFARDAEAHARSAYGYEGSTRHPLQSA